MPTLREVRSRIIGVAKTQKITRAMKMVAAAKLRRAQMAVLAARPYATTMQGLLGHLALQAGEDADPLLVPRQMTSVALVVVTADRGLCGAFNTNIVKAAQARIIELQKIAEEEELPRPLKVQVVAVGKKGSDFFRTHGYPLKHAYPGVFQHLTFSTAQEIARTLVAMFRSGEVDRVEIIYNEFKNVAQQKIVTDQFLPVPAEAVAEGAHKHGTDYIYEPSGIAILSALIPRYLDFRIWRAMLESNAAEEGARMTAMENATENAEEMISSLQLQYNKARQASITKELLEIVAGAEALAH